MKCVHCLGVLVLDALSGPIAHYPVRGQCIQVNTEKIQFLPGGGAANTASALCQMGIPARIFSKIGNDPQGAFLLRDLEAHGVDTSGVKVSERDSTPFTFVGIHRDGERTFIHTPGANRTFSIDDINREELFDTDYLLYTDLWVMPRLDGYHGSLLLQEAKEHSVVTLLDECWGLGPNRESFECMAPYVDYLLPSYHDLLEIYPNKEPQEMIADLHKLGVPNIILKMGEAGCLLSCGGRIELIPSMATSIVDTTGAGDTFVAGFIAGLVHGYDRRESAVIGANAAAASIRNVGGATGIPPFEFLL